MDAIGFNLAPVFLKIGGIFEFVRQRSCFLAISLPFTDIRDSGDGKLQRNSTDDWKIIKENFRINSSKENSLVLRWIWLKITQVKPGFSLSQAKQIILLSPKSPWRGQQPWKMKYMFFTICSPQNSKWLHNPGFFIACWIFRIRKSGKSPGTLIWSARRPCISLSLGEDEYHARKLRSWMTQPNAIIKDILLSNREEKNTDYLHLQKTQGGESSLCIFHFLDFSFLLYA